ncbi:hypothetical protein MMRN_34010 [Mycobacterium marinum]|nr:hypothetical protein MMRN_34010 [Mycobacterium marinum]
MVIEVGEGVEGDHRKTTAGGEVGGQFGGGQYRGGVVSVSMNAIRAWGGGVDGEVGGPGFEDGQDREDGVVAAREQRDDRTRSSPVGGGEVVGELGAGRIELLVGPGVVFEGEGRGVG